MTSIDFARALRRAHDADPGEVPEVIAAVARELGASDVVTYLVDFGQSVLEPLGDRAAHPDVPATEEVATTMAGRAFLDRSPVTSERPDGHRVWVPITEGSERTGVLAMTVPDVDEPTRQTCQELGVLAGYLIAMHARSTDVYNLFRRRRSMSLAASLQWDLLPPLSLRAPGVAVAGMLEPAYQVGGDCFDYALNGPVLDIGVVDAMGHGVGSAIISSLAIGCYRHNRREGRSLAYAHADLDAVLAARYGGEAFATGQLAQLQLASGVLSLTNAGHPPPFHIRGGQVIAELDVPPVLPWGLSGGEPTVATVRLEPLDTVLFYTDGVIEARSAEDEMGVDRLMDLVGRSMSDQLELDSVVRHLARAIVEHHHHQLFDDATVVMVRWNGPRDSD